MLRSAAVGILIAIMALLPEMCAAQTQPVPLDSRIELPLGGYYRPGRAMPAVVRSGDSASPIILTCDGMIPIRLPARFSGTIPIYILNSSPTVELTATQADRPLMKVSLHALAPDQRLIGLATDDPATLQQLFPDRRAVSVRVGTDRSWLNSSFLSSLDAIVFHQAAQPELLRSLEAGILVAVTSESAPDIQLPWKRTGSLWTVSASIAGPDSTVGGESVFLATQGWHQETSPPLRGRIGAAAVVVSLLLVGCLLLKSPQLRLVAGCGVSIAACGGIGFWMLSLPRESVVSGNIVVAAGGLVQTDHWTYLATGESGSGVLKHSDLPIVYDQAQLRSIGLQSVIEADGRVSWEFSLPAHSKLALLRRRLEMGTVPALLKGDSASPLESLVRGSYLKPGFKIAGQLRSPRSEWGTTVVIPE